ncbi:MAG TPA: hypothetical protein VG348_15785 [Acidimicrobiia bacterium]|jgi:hypothetical protein|nr:hypothetical protein [Acidimicrobiia bacterium]
MTKTKTAQLGGEASALVAGILAAVLGTKHGAVNVSQLGQLLVALVAGVASAAHAPKVVHRVRRRKPRPLPGPRQIVVVWDTVTASAIGHLASTSSDAVMAYGDGAYADLAEIERDYPGHKHYTIDDTGQDPACEFLDVEPGAAPVERAAGWIRERAKLLGIPISRVVLVKWVASWTGIPGIPRGYQGCQFADPAFTGRNVDESWFYADALTGEIIGLYVDAANWPEVFAALRADGLGHVLS